MSGSKEILILESSADELRLTLMQPHGSGARVLDSCSVVMHDKRDDRTALQNQVLVDDLAVPISEKDWVGKDVFCLIAGQTVSCQFFDMPALADQALRQAVLLKLGQQLHFPVADAIVDVRTVSSATAAKHHQVRTVVTAVHQDAAHAAVDAATRWGLRLVGMSASTSALGALAVDQANKTNRPEAVLHMGDRFSSLIVLCGESPIVTCELPIGLDDFTKALMRPIINGDDVIQLDQGRALDLRDAVGIPDADQMIDSLGIHGAKLYPLIEPTLQKIVQQLTQWLTFAASIEGGEKVASLKITGPGARLIGLASALSRRLKIEASVSQWLDGLVTADGAACGMALDGFAAAVSAVRHQNTLPDLVPPDIRRLWKVRRVRRSTALICPIVAVVILGFTFLFNQVRQYTQTALGTENRRSLNELQTLVDLNARWESEQQRVRELQSQLSTFSEAVPAWEGLFKELSHLLPSEMRATKLKVAMQGDCLHTRLDSNIYTTPNGRDFDEVIEQTILALERSPYFEKVQLINSVRYPADGTRVESGIMSVDLRLAYLHPAVAAEARP